MSGTLTAQYTNKNLIKTENITTLALCQTWDNEKIRDYYIARVTLPENRKFVDQIEAPDRINRSNYTPTGHASPNVTKLDDSDWLTNMWPDHAGKTPKL